MLKNIDEFIFRFIKTNIGIMPKRFVKAIANYYPDARIRKIYWDKLGVYMGDGTYPNLGFDATYKFDGYGIHIGDNVSIGPSVILLTESNANNGKKINDNAYVRDVLTKYEKIVIEDEVWLGANVTILPGVHVGTCSVIGAGSVVTKDVESYSVYAGVPARKIRDLKEFED